MCIDTSEIYFGMHIREVFLWGVCGVFKIYSWVFVCSHRWRDLERVKSKLSGCLLVFIKD